ncbi:hypothetical protein FSP39_020329 [Pinctada imbricata]|uniref:Uncharacterized protein n=1 Tax=Pinctada imbricata TaxID=66713 RepID=A0AA88YP45_PINIB|nr:hypothetical protein FSP39_020329 [Pinctada imbricata]
MESKSGKEDDLVAEYRYTECHPDGVMKKVQKQLQKLKLKWMPSKKYQNLSKENFEGENMETSLSVSVDKDTGEDKLSKTDTTHTAVREIDENVKENIESSSPPNVTGSTISKPHHQQRRMYDFTHRKRGFAVLVIYNEFQHQPKRDSAILDIDSMTAVFQTLGFDVLCLQNQTTEQLIKNMKVIGEHIKEDHDCFACVVSTHGAETKKKGSQLRQQLLYTYDGTVSCEELFEIFKDRKCKALRGKPRIFFVQACRGVMPERKNHSDIDRGTDVNITSPYVKGSSAANFNNRSTPSGKDNPVPLEQTQSNRDEIESTADTRHGYEDYNYANRRSEDCQGQGNMYAKFDDAMGQIDDITRRIQQRTMSPGGSQGVHQHTGVRNESSRNYERNGYMQNNVMEDKRNEQSRLIPKGSNVNSQNIPFADDMTEFYVPKPLKPLDFCTIPVYNDYVAMFSAASGTIAWSDGDKGGWLLFCLYNVVKALRKSDFEIDLLQILTDTAGKMAIEMRSYNSNPKYDGAKAAAVVYHRLRKEIYLTPKSHDLETYNV